MISGSDWASSVRNYRFARRISEIGPSAIRELLKHGADPEIISFAGGYPDPLLFPRKELRAIFEELLSSPDLSVLQYSPSEGLQSLRAHIARRHRASGIDCGDDDVLIVHGSQQGIDLVAKLVLDPGDIIITESPTFLGALAAFNAYEPAYASVRMDAGGMDMDDLHRVLQANPTAKLLYAIPDFHNPTGVTMALDRRKRLVELADEFNLIVIEDAPYRELRFEGDELPTLKSFDTQGRVIHLGSFSKILAPGLRLGWVVADPEIVTQLCLLKLAADTQCSTINMAAVSVYLDRVDIEAHIAEVNKAYCAKRDVMIETLSSQLPASVTFTRPLGGLFTWLTFPPGFDSADFLQKVALPKAKMAYVPGATFFPTESAPNHARLSYSVGSVLNIKLGVHRLCRELYEFAR